jgi:hypothetical protein
MLHENIVKNAVGDEHIVNIAKFMKLVPVFQPTAEALLENSKKALHVFLDTTMDASQDSHHRV